MKIVKKDLFQFTYHVCDTSRKLSALTNFTKKNHSLKNSALSAMYLHLSMVGVGKHLVYNLFTNDNWLQYWLNPRDTGGTR